MQIRIAGTVNDSIVDGPGFRYTVFAQGCLLNCPGCHNPATHPLDGGQLAQTEDLIAQMADNPLLDGITLSGGDPFLQPEPCTALARAARNMGLSVWAYSGLTFEELLALDDQPVQALLRECDVLVDGRFVQSKRTLELRFRGSTNQRLIDVQASLKSGNAVEYTI